MSKMIQLRHVPDKVHRTLKARAAMKGMSLSDYLVRQVTQIAKQPTDEEIMARIARRKPFKLDPPAAVIIREMRDTR